ncbi:MAG: outer membrane beta-barrel protein [Myxococcota bacterium]|nr:outer membrane beta-barrel protein [Myxococcota bacterium]
MRRATMMLLLVLGASWLTEGLADAQPRARGNRSGQANQPAAQPAPPARPQARRAQSRRAYRPARRPPPAGPRYAPRRVHHVYRGGVWVAVPPPAPVYYHPGVVVHHPAPATRVVRKAPAPEPTVGLLLKLGALGFSPEHSGMQGDDLSLGSVGAAMRFNFDPHWAMELSAETARGSDSYYGIERSTVPLSASLVLNLLPRSALNLYGLAGVGMQFTEARVNSYGYKTSYTRPTGHLGAGAELRLSRALRLFSDLKFIGLGAPMGEDVTGSSSSLPSYLALQEGDAAIQFSAGLGFYF